MDVILNSTLSPIDTIHYTIPDKNSTGVSFAERSLITCPDMGEDNLTYNERVDLINFQYYAWGVTGTLLVAFGLVGNALSIIVLTHKSMRQPTSCYLVALAIYDTLVLVSFLMSFSLPMLSRSYHDMHVHIQPILYPLALIAQTCSIYTTVGFTVERYFAVCHPLQAAKLCTIARARKSILVILLCCLLYNIPRMLEYKTLTCFDSSYGDTITIVEKTSLGENMLFRRIYFIGLHMFVFLLIPCFVLMILNFLLIRAVQKSQKTEGRISNRTQRENNLTIMLTIVVAVFLICELPSIADNILDVLLAPQHAHRPMSIKFYVISSLFVQANSASNFYLYCLFGQRFRRVFVEVLLCRYGRSGRTPGRQGTMILRSYSSVRGGPSRTNSYNGRQPQYTNGYIPVNYNDNNRLSPVPITRSYSGISDRSSSLKREQGSSQFLLNPVINVSNQQKQHNASHEHAAK